eukprot:CAMPEP_0202892656 /NCGR_PEP_ID=MMETSP1392-20130828/2370_1 /ASSEMBLY_ACC=CAM_ASM_000868 /TAXON_ID=225041 /ORGANISM="Chlamydomonas chlamydogama, Strain SAG 11-48b" /LENGTH=120 /DNA_ID=CAMNT_0049576697 /DNA_START=199 /DNA_END=561 /DNA_ORIENTATION=+
MAFSTPCITFVPTFSMDDTGMKLHHDGTSSSTLSSVVLTISLALAVAWSRTASGGADILSTSLHRTTFVMLAVNLLLISSTDLDPFSSQDRSLMVQPCASGSTVTETVKTGSTDQLNIRS